MSEAPWRKGFLAALELTGNVTAAATAAGIERTTAYKARYRSEETESRVFAKAWDEALEHATDLMEIEARRRALDGVEEPVYYKGEIVGGVRKYSDLLLIFMLKAHRPEKYRENLRVEHAGSVTVRTLADIAQEIAEEDNNG